jgi:hypothetical protein
MGAPFLAQIRRSVNAQYRIDGSEEMHGCGFAGRREAPNAGSRKNVEPQKKLESNE